MLTLQDDDGRQRTQESIRVGPQFHREGRDITTAEAIKPSQVANRKTAIGRSVTSFIGLIKRVVGYAHVFGADNFVSFLDVRI